MATPNDPLNQEKSGRVVKPVFFDPAHKRWPRLRLGMALIGLTLSLLLGALLLSILASPALPALNLPGSSIVPHGAHMVPPAPTPPIERALTRRERALRDTEAKLKRERERSLQQLLTQARSRAPDEQPLAIGFFVNWDDTSMSSLKENLGSLDMVIPEWLHLASEDGSLRENDPNRAAQVTRYIRMRRPDLRIMPLVNNWSGQEWEGGKLGRMLANPAARARTIEQLAAYVDSHGFAGVSVDFENIAARDQPALRRFIGELYAVLHPRNLLLSVNVPASDPAFNYSELARNVDYLILMAYDEHWSTGAPGPIASLPWFAKVLHQRQRDVPAQKTIVAIGNYAYDWAEGHHAEERSFEEAVLTAKESEGNIHLDPVSLNPTFDYADDEDHIHHVWLLDAVTAFNQLVVARSVQPRGVALWRLGSEDPALWQVFGKYGPLDAERAAQLADMRFGYGLDYEGQGEILQITAQPQHGHRLIAFDVKRNLITAERFTTFPSPYVITRHGSQKRKVALTFDDGPDPQYTPQILDALRQAGVHATFFIIGANGELYPELLRREVEEGHEIGNHTFSHPNIAVISPTQFQLELSATQRLLASAVGRQSLLFRPPYAVDAEPETADQVRPIELASGQGYLTVGMQIDPDDWQRPGVDEIVRRTVEEAERGEGNVILLHDAGGDRSQTVQAIPRIIEALRNHGFQFVTIAELLGRSRDEVMPPVAPESLWEIWMDRAAFGVINLTTVAIYGLFLLGIVLGISRLLFIGVLAVYHHRRKRRATFDTTYSPAVAVVVPAYNEEKVIVQTMTSLLASDHPDRFEIIMVDDGSTDATYRQAQDAFCNDPRVRIYTKPNGGKPSALNFGVAQTRAEIVVALDADTVFTRDTIAKLVRHFADPRVGAVAGNAKVGNRTNLLTRWQALEYITSQNLDRRAFDVLNCITVVPGAVGAWRRELIEQAGGFTHATLAEDADLTIAIRKLGYSIVYEDEAVALTEAPDTVRGFIRQRYRWMFGTMQAAWKHVDALFRPRYGALGFVALPNVVIFQVLFPLISPIMDLLLLGSLGMAALNHWQHPAEYSPDGLWHVLFYYALFLMVDFLAAALAFALERKENKWLLIGLFWQRFCYRQLMYHVAIKSTLASLRGVLVGWGKLERKATVKAQDNPVSHVSELPG
jgi:cellulose synthase/poly-beta-1,6-N-acetylglucosamine synthase-like glycosyltransferase/peptidoglycan/xylan/chitin deacetylase (PgdA/CDA1 family)/spore germination protein YaaH